MNYYDDITQDHIACRIIHADAIQIPTVSGEDFEFINVCCMNISNQICINYQKKITDEDEPIFLTLENAKDLVNELIKSISILEDRQNENR